MKSIAESSPGSRADWLSARAALAGRRSGRFALGATATFLAVLLVLLIIPQLGITVTSKSVKARETRKDTLALLRAALDAQRAADHTDSVYHDALLAVEHRAGDGRALSPTQRRRRDSLRVLATQLDTLLDRSAKAPLPPSYIALATADAVQEDSRARLLTDSLDALEKRRAGLGPTNDAGRLFADLTKQMNDVGLAIREMTTRRRSALARELAGPLSLSPQPPVADTARSRLERDSARVAATTATASLTATRTYNEDLDRRDGAARDRANHQVPPIAMLGAAVILAVMIGFSTSLLSEIGRPTIANAREAEQVARCPVIATARDAERAPRAGAIDPFRMLYLGLTATGTRTRTVIVSGDDCAVVATVAGRLALAAAGDARATLVVDADAEASGVAGYYNQRPEPGFTDAVAGVRLWREVARSVGASDGLSIDVIPGGSIRRDEADAATLQAAHTEFSRFRNEYDFCVAVASSDLAVQRISALVDEPTMVLCAEVGHTTLENFARQAARLRDSGANLQGVILWDAISPQVQHRSTLMGRALVRASVNT